MSAWNSIERLMLEMSIEKKAAAAGAGSVSGGRPRQREIWRGDLGKRSLEDELEVSSDERRKPGMSFMEWNDKINEYLNHLVKIYRHVKGKADKVITAFRNYEKSAAEAGVGDVDTLRQDRYEHYETYDEYILQAAIASGNPGPAHALRQMIRNRARQRQFVPGEETDILTGAPVSAEFDPIAAEMGTPEFKRFEEWARQVWNIYGKDPGGNPIEVDDETWKQVMYFFASSGHKFAAEHPDAPRKIDEITIQPDPDEPHLSYRPGHPSEEPLYRVLMAKGQEGKSQAAQILVAQIRKTLEANRQLAVQRQQQIDIGYESPKPPPGMSPEMVAKWNEFYGKKGVMVPYGRPSRPQIDPMLFKKRRFEEPPPRERRKFPTWWDLGFKGDIPFTDM